MCIRDRSGAMSRVEEELTCVLLSAGFLIGYHVYWYKQAQADYAAAGGLTTRGTMGVIRESWIRKFVGENISTVPLNTLRNHIAVLRYSGSSSLMASVVTAGYVVNMRVQDTAVDGIVYWKLGLLSLNFGISFFNFMQVYFR
eukprot:TRINITY_DN9555_c0_g1_i2.p3 TRINITY_DN9555_c0_g1~~TRINITY_DN9555_c0_g1_i2.p3  ORF type:complete len:142 (+),score=42.80 TRINITY_DN9555_c0_g1_i2:166-591(+)